MDAEPLQDSRDTVADRTTDNSSSRLESGFTGA
jgi:hypothetical protein